MSYFISSQFDLLVNSPHHIVYRDWGTGAIASKDATISVALGSRETGVAHL
ncbi:MAG: hypothetical protein AB4352_28325 [Hormoscilla sp.]